MGKKIEAEAQKPKTCTKKRGGGAKRPVITTVSGAEPVISVFQKLLYSGLLAC